MAKNNKNEEIIQIKVCDYLRKNHNDIIFNSDLAGWLSIGLNIKSKKLRSGNKFPDLVIYEPNKKYCGLFIEIKTVDSFFKKNGEERIKSKHISEQVKKLIKLNKKGYLAVFGVGYKHCIYLIECYLKLNK